MTAIAENFSSESIYNGPAVVPVLLSFCSYRDGSQNDQDRCRNLHGADGRVLRVLPAVAELAISYNSSD